MSFNELDNDIALERQIRLILSSFGSDVIVKDDYYNFRCNVCGDSKKSKFKRRGYILKKKKPWIFYCHNCFYKKPVISWMKEFFPVHYKDFYREVIRTNKQHSNKPLPKIKNTNTTLHKFTEKEQTKFFIPIKKGTTPLFAKAVRTCIERKIPEEVWSKWFVATGGMYNNRLIIPFFNKEGKIYFYQGRALFDYMKPKYLSRKGNFNSIYNYFLVDKNKPVVVLEGPIDSIFVENSIALTGIKIEDKRLKIFPYKRYLIDFDSKILETKEKIIELLSKGEYVFCWKKFIKAFNLPMREKWDINDVILYLNKDKFTYTELEPFFTNSIFDKIFFI